MELLTKFKAFALKGNVIDLAVWVIIGTAFGKIVSSLVGDVVMPLLGALLNTVDFTKLSYPISTLSGGEVVVNYGKFLQSLFDFIIIAFAIFTLINLLDKATRKFKLQQEKEEQKKEETLAPDIQLLQQIRDILAEKSEKIPAKKMSVSKTKK
jgi:large conductance mechanosensitive channel